MAINWKEKFVFDRLFLFSSVTKCAKVHTEFKSGGMESVISFTLVIALLRPIATTQRRTFWKRVRMPKPKERMPTAKKIVAAEMKTQHIPTILATQAQPQWSAVSWSCPALLWRCSTERWLFYSANKHDGIETRRSCVSVSDVVRLRHSGIFSMIIVHDSCPRWEEEWTRL